jgi:hypothetical protein
MTKLLPALYMSKANISWPGKYVRYELLIVGCVKLEILLN